jgi:hypothetical protein
LPCCWSRQGAPPRTRITSPARRPICAAPSHSINRCRSGLGCALGSCGLLAYYPFDEGKGNVVTDATGQGNDGTHNALYVPGERRATALSFDGTTGAIIPANKLNWGDKNADFTVEYFVKVTGPPNGQWRTVHHKGGVDAERTDAQFLLPANLQVVSVVTTTNDPNASTPATALNLNTWNHVAHVKNGNWHLLFLNGLRVRQEQISPSIGNWGPLYLGKDPWNAGLTGYIDEVRIYARALYGGEIRADIMK